MDTPNIVVYKFKHIVTGKPLSYIDLTNKIITGTKISMSNMDCLITHTAICHSYMSTEYTLNIKIAKAIFQELLKVTEEYYLSEETIESPEVYFLKRIIKSEEHALDLAAHYYEIFDKNND